MAQSTRPYKRPKPTIPAYKIERRPVRWLWREHIPWGMLSLVAGRPEKGKSLLAILIAAEVSQHYAVIISSHEDQKAETMKPRLEAAGANMRNIYFWRKGSGFSLPHDVRPLRDEIERLGVALVIMDPVASHTRASIYNTTAIREALSPLYDMGEDLDVAFFMIHHVIKNVDLKADPQAAIGGAGGGIGAMARAAYLFGESPDDPDERLLVQLKCNVAKKRSGLKFELDVEDFDDGEEAPVLHYMGTTTYSPNKVFTAVPQMHEEKLENAAEWLVAQLREGPMSARKILLAGNEAGFTKRSIKFVADILEVETVKKKWRLSKEFPIA